jgi:outer membrane receptor protein involved in Fe transport
MNNRQVAALLAAASTLAWPAYASAQQSAASGDANTIEEEAVEDAPLATGGEAEPNRIVVTGSRVVRTGVQEPTPVTIVAVEDLQRAAPTNIPDALNQLPQFQGSRSVTGGAGGNVLSNANEPRAGNYLNLRNVGSQRMLILLNGRRVPPTSFEGIVDTNTIPQGLVERVDVVTAGASAVYGADAVSGVVNFVLDTDLEGIRGTIQNGISSYGDNANWRASLAGGVSFGEGRGHIVASYDHFDSAGVPNKSARPSLFDPENLFFQAGSGTEADPYRTISGVRAVGYTYGGLITGASNPAAAAALQNLQFINSSETRPLQLGEPVFVNGVQSTSVRLGGEGAVGIPDTVLAAKLKTDQAFAHARYDLTDGITAFVQGSYTRSRNEYNTMYDSRVGTTALRIYSENPYLPADVRQVLNSTGAEYLLLAKYLNDLPVGYTDTVSTSWTTTAGLEGTFNFLDDGRWDVFWTHGDSRLKTSQVQNENRNLYAAIDAVDEGAFLNGTPNGNIVCRVSLTNPGLVPGCVPANMLGSGSYSAEAIDFISNTTQFQVNNKLDEIGANFGGSLFDLGAGPIGFNVGLGYRRQSLLETSNSDPSVPVDYTGGSNPNNPATYTGIRGVPGLAGPTPNPPQRFHFTNVGTADGTTETKEAYGEIVAPLLSGVPVIEYFELNGAVRYTDYKTSGGVWTWKVGGIWEPVPGARLRATYSKDIREPTLYDLFAGRQQNPSFFDDQGFTNQNLPTLLVSGGNPDLRPEVGHTLAVGLILQPEFLPGFSASIDYYDLEIEDAIGRIGTNVIRDQCASSGGTDPLCDLIIRPFPLSNTSPDNFPTQILQFPVNIASIDTEGIDFDIGYRMDFAGGTLSLRALANRLLEYKTNSGAGARTFDLTGLVGRSKWKHTISANYNSAGGLGIFTQVRIIGEAQRDTPGNTGFIYEQQEVPAETYVDLTLNYDLKAEGVEVSPFFTVNNLLNNKPPILSNSFVPGIILQTDPGTYDILGRRFTIGVRFNY